MRDKLRLATRQPHEILDALMRPLDLTQTSGMTIFLQIQYYALSCLEPVIAQSRHVAPPQLYLTELQNDLAALSAVPMSFSKDEDVGSLHPLGAAYVVAGSHSGAKLMLREWQKAMDPSVVAAGQFLSSAAKGDAWPVVGGYLKTCRLDEAEEDRVVDAALDCFSLYQRAYHAAVSQGFLLSA